MSHRFTPGHVAMQEEAEKYCRDGLAMSRKLLGNENPKVAAALHQLGNVLATEDKFTDSETTLRQALAMYQKVIGNECLEVARVLSDLAMLLERQDRLAEAETTLRDSLAMKRKLLDNRHPEVADSLSILGFVLLQQGKEAEAMTVLREAVKMWRELQATERPEFVNALQELAIALVDQDKLAEAEPICREALAISRRLFRNENTEVILPMERLVEVLEKQGKQAEAEALCRDQLASALSLFQRTAPDDPKRSDYALYLGYSQEQLADHLAKTDRRDEAEQILRESLPILEQAARASRAEFFPRQKHAHSTWLFAAMLESWGRFDTAEAEYRLAIALHESASVDFPDRTVFTERLAEVKMNLVELLRRRGRLDEVKSIYRDTAEHGGAAELNTLAWSLATSADPSLRDGTNAVVFAEKAVTATSRTNGIYLDTLAAAYAEVDQFTNAVRVQQEAIALLQNELEIKDYDSRLKLYENKLPYRDHYSLAELISERLAEGKFAEAETPARECLSIREKVIPDDWRTFNARSMLGASLLGQKKYAEAEPLLLSGDAGMQQRADEIPANSKVRLQESVQRLVQLYEATGQSEKAAEWKKKLVGPDKAKE
jgi:tetratricopeptide (TPR) repeat protein